MLARGDRRGFVAVDVHGEVYAIPKWARLKTKQVREKLGDPKQLRSVDEAKHYLAQAIQPALLRWQLELDAKKNKLKEQQDRARAMLVKKQCAQRERLKSRLNNRRIVEAEQRQARFRSGLQGLWDRVRGEHRKIRKENELDAWQAHVRDQKQMDELVFRDLEDRRALKRGQSVEQSLLVQSDTELSHDQERFEELRKKPKLSSHRDPTFER